MVAALLLAPLLAAAGGEVVLLDGTKIAGTIAGIVDGAATLSGRDEPLAFYEIDSIVFAPAAPDKAPAQTREKAPSLDAGPVVLFRDGGAVAAQVLDADSSTLGIRLPGATGALRVPVEILRAVRLREAHPSDNLFEVDANGAPPAQDTVYVRRGSNLLRIEGVFRGMDRESLHLEYEGKVRRLSRPVVFGIVLAPIAPVRVEGDYPALFELCAGGSLPAFLTGLRQDNAGGGAGEGSGGQREILVRFRGAASAAPQAIPESLVARVKFSSDRVLFLSTIDPAAVEETPILGTKPAFPWQRDRASSRGPLKLGGKAFRKGLGVHARSVLDYDIRGAFRSFAAVIGLDDAAGPEAGVRFRVLADGKEIFRRDLKYGEAPESLLLPAAKVNRLRLEVDFGADGLDLGDHADWADARLVK
jgi:hypothetical protein